MKARRILGVLGRGEVIVPLATLSIVGLLITSLYSWGPAWSQARAEAAAREAAAARTWRPGAWAITTADVPQGELVPVQDSWRDHLSLGRLGEFREATVPYRVPGLRHLVTEYDRSLWNPVQEVTDSLHGVRSGPVEVFSMTFTAGSTYGPSHPLGPDGVTEVLRHAVAEVEDAAGEVDGLPADAWLLDEPRLTTTCRAGGECASRPGEEHRVTFTGVEVVPSWIAPRRVTVSATWVDRVVVAVATVSPVGAEVPAELRAPHLLDVLAAKVEADPPAPRTEDLDEAAVSPARGGGGAR